MTLTLSQKRTHLDGRNDKLFKWAVAAAGFFVLISLFAAAAMMFKGGFDAFSTFGFKFLTSTNWDPVQRDFGALVPMHRPGTRRRRCSLCHAIHLRARP